MASPQFPRNAWRHYEHGVGPVVRNKANFPALAGMDAGRQDHRRRWAKACETKPIPPERYEGQVLYGKRVRANRARLETRKNKANFRPGQE